MQLNELLEDLVPGTLPVLDIKGLETNSSRVREGHIFFAIKGHQSDGHDYIEDAIQAGAVAVIGTREHVEIQVPYIQVENIRYILAHAAKRYYGNPSAQKVMIGITGTNGKTTTSFLLKHMLEAAGYSCALFGTVNYIINGETLTSPNTTPDSLQLQKYIRESQDDVVIMEVSSHGIDQLRIEGIEFDYALFTNLDHDHLDYHHTMEAYFAVKARLFEQLKTEGHAVVNTLNSYGHRLVGLLKEQHLPVLTLGVSTHHDARLDMHKRVLEIAGKPLELSTIVGSHNVQNAAMAALTAAHLGTTMAQVQEGLEAFTGVPGRFQIYRLDDGVTAVVDYAHTAEAFEHILRTAKEEGAENLFHVFGFRGNRDRTKRQKMVDVSNKWSTHVILTFDDLNGLEPVEMERQLCELQFEGRVIADRTIAIQSALEEAQSGDWVLITGKGTETYKQSFELPCTSDSEVVENWKEQSSVV